MAQRQFRSDDTSIWNDKFGNGYEGSYSPTTGIDSPVDSNCTGTSGTTSLSATNGAFAIGQKILIYQTYGTNVGKWELNKIAGYTAGTITTSYTLCNTYSSGAQVQLIHEYTTLNIASGQTITAKPWNGATGGIYVKFANISISIVGNLICSGTQGSGTTGGATGGFRGGTGRSTSGAAEYADGTTGLRATATSAAANGNGGGGGKALASVANEGPGGSGGHATAGGTGSGNGAQWNGAGGGTAGSADLTTMVFGGGGGGGTAVAGLGGASGGGIIILISPSITVSGTVYSKGGNGNPSYGAGGAGAGGSILLKGKTISIGTNLVRADGGAGAGDNANPGGSGRIHADYSVSLTGTTTPTIDSTNDLTITENAGGAFLLNMI